MKSFHYGDRCKVQYSPGVWSSNDAMRRVGKVGRVADTSGNGEGVKIVIPIVADNGYCIMDEVWLHPDCLQVINH